MFILFSDIKITPFNLKEEQEEGEFATDGSFVWKKSNEVNDAWLDNVDWVQVKEVSYIDLVFKKDFVLREIMERNQLFVYISQVSEADKVKKDAADDAEDEAEAAYDEIATYRQMILLMKPGESVAKTIRRLGGSNSGGAGQKMAIQKQRKIAQKLKKGQKLTDDEELFHKSRQEMEKMTGLADLILSRSGNMEIYDETFEKITFYLNQKEQEKASKSVGVTSGSKDENLLDMFAKDLDDDGDNVSQNGNFVVKKKFLNNFFS